uniref:Transposase, YhgA-like n=2 Tax=unclassified Candidatus Kentrum TaxID=2643149 RepID=A0A450ZFB4_9GAMM|nr:MAG: Putative transposase, YhgA-like [Candidatus Kentron sp. TUN]VFK52466.1 MAG: Putative transposase, YhgA-like [Candidatus Kentron sp. TUN]VFK57983.1 MAG: Putative transposase, YhgA-like [Candidatus Kentron sp. TUN]
MGDKDIVSKEIIGKLAAYLAIYLLDLPIDPDFQEAKGTEHQRVEDRRADLVVELRKQGGEPFFLHIEIQNDNDPKMPVRMMRYLTDVLLAHPGLPVRQYLIYIGAEKLTMPDEFRGPDTHHRYGLVDMRSVDCEYLIKKDTPEALVLAILCNFKGRDPQEVVNYIYMRLQELVGNNTKRLRECIHMLHILSVNRNLKKEIKEAEKMLTQIDMTRIPSYQIGMEKGLEVGMEKGMKKGMEKGEIAFFTHLLSHKFGTLPPLVAQRINNARPEELAIWGERVLTAKSLDEVFS